MTMNLASPISKKQSLQNPWSFAQFKANLSFFFSCIYGSLTYVVEQPKNM